MHRRVWLPFALLPAFALAFACSSESDDTRNEATAPPIDEAGTPNRDPGDAGLTADEPEPPLGSVLPRSKRGTRLERELWKGGGVSVLSAFVDTERADARCTFATAEDGALRCLPGLKNVAQFLGPSCDEAAMIAVATLGAEAASESELRVPRGDECTRTHAVYGIGAPVSPAPADRWLRNGEGACVKAPALAASAVVRAVTSAIAPTSFVAGTRQVAKATTRLREQRVVADDGAFYAEAIHDTKHDSRCSSGTAADTSTRCFLADIGPVFYGDLECTSLFLTTTDQCDRPQAFVTRNANPGGSAYLETLRPGAPYDGGVRRGRPSACFTMPNPPAKLFVSTPLPTTDLAPIAQSYEGPDRMRSLVYSGDDGAKLVTTRFAVGTSNIPRETLFDQTLNTSCVVEEFEGEVRCVPLTLSGSLTFGDDACTQLVVVNPDVGAPTPPVFFRTAQAGVPVTYHRIGQKLPLTTAYYRAGDTCTALGLGPTPDIRELAPAEPPSSFQTFTRAVE